MVERGFQFHSKYTITSFSLELKAVPEVTLSFIFIQFSYFFSIILQFLDFWKTRIWVCSLLSLLVDKSRKFITFPNKFCFTESIFVLLIEKRSDFVLNSLVDRIYENLLRLGHFQIHGQELQSFERGLISIIRV